MYRVFLISAKNQRFEIHGFKSKLASAKITKAVNSVYKFEFTCLPDNVAYTECKPFVTRIEAWSDNLLFKGRVLSSTNEMTTEGKLQCEVTCESELAYLHDSYQNYGKWQNISPTDFFKKIIEVHNSQVESYKRFKIGRCDVRDPNNSIYRYTADETSTYDTLEDKLIKRLGGELRLRYESDGTYIDYVATTAKLGNQIIGLSKNLRSLKQSINPEDIITVLKPLGKTIETPSDQANDQTDSDASKPRLTIESVNSGSKWLRDEKKIAEFGIQAGAETWDDVTEASNLLRKGKEFLANQTTAKVQYQLSAVDLALIDKTIDEFTCGNYYHVYNPLMGIDENLRVVGQSLDLVDVTNSSLTIGDRFLSQEELSYQRRKEVEKAMAKRAEVMALAKTYDFLKKENALFEENLKKLQVEVTNLKPAAVGKIIDVSEWQGVIDWPQVLSQDIALSIIRIQDGSSHQDLKYMENLQKCIAAGGKYAVYAYFRASTIIEAQQEAQDFYDRTQVVVTGKQQPVFYAIDVESIEMGGNSSLMRGGVEAYMSKLNALGIPDNRIVLYIANHLYNTFNLNVARAGAVWIPSYGKNDGTLANSLKPTYSYDLWQYTSKGTISGITGYVDLNTSPSERFRNNYL